MQPRVVPGTGRVAAGRFTSAERRALAGYGGAVLLLHLLGWALCLQASRQHPALLALGLSAYLFGLRHAFDADHIVAVDDTVRLLLGRAAPRPLGIGFYFSIGHSSVVLVLALLAAWFAGGLRGHLAELRQFGDLAGTLVSGAYLWLIGLLNLLLLLQLLRPDGHAAHAHARPRGLIARLLGRRLRAGLRHSWQMLPVGVLFGLGFDTASEIALLALTAGAAGAAPMGAVLALPLLFGAGMSLLDTADGVLMVRLYAWAADDPARTLRYKLVTTTLSIAAALLVGSAELLQLATAHGGWRMPGVAWLDTLPSPALGAGFAGVLALAWCAAWWRAQLRRPATFAGRSS